MFSRSVRHYLTLAIINYWFILDKSLIYTKYQRGRCPCNFSGKAVTPPKLVDTYVYIYMK